ncbi:MAG: putative zinc-binding metallopeptidase [Terriglobales bacterium]
MDSFRELEAVAERCFLKLLGVYNLQPKPTDDPALTKLGEQLKIKFITDDSLDCDDFKYDAPSKSQLAGVIDPIVFELQLYPHDALHKTRIEQVVLCTNLLVSDKRAGGTLKVGLHYVDTLFINLSGFAASNRFGARTLHHELYHAIDFRDSFEGYVDTEWSKLQGQEFQYELDQAANSYRYRGYNPQEVKKPEFADPFDWLHSKKSDTPGFITEYAKYNVTEDKAELFSFLMMNYKEVMSRTEHDQILKHKVEHMKTALNSFSRSLDDAFWERIAHTNRDA